MPIKVGNTGISEIYVGGTKITQAYRGSTLIYQLATPPAGYDSYKVHLTWSRNDNFNMAGLKINGVQATTSQVSSISQYDGGWHDASSADIASAIDWNNNQGKSFYGTEVVISFTSAATVTEVQVHTGLWYGGGSMAVTMYLDGVKDGVETYLGRTSETNSSNKIYTVSV